MIRLRNSMRCEMSVPPGSPVTGTSVGAAADSAGSASRFTFLFLRLAMALLPTDLPCYAGLG